MPLDPVSRSILKICGLLLVLLLVWFHGHGKGAALWEGKYDAEKSAHKQTRDDNARVLRGLADLTKRAQQEAKDRATAYRDATAQNDATNRTEMAHALAAKDRVIADLRAGRIQLRDFWTPALSCPGDAAAPAIASREAEYAGLREQSLAEGVQDGALADGWISWLQRELIATRAACTAPVVVE
ncbi:hypothetical protein LJR143_002195 [Pseudoxanthomonas sp. LjRoot143]|uniref:hypothetical protein n=1 Tax=Pseudoxanthomonas sp. LjRoot143 TaxID=3342266 RepID=UPI003ECF13F4